jgi:L-lactate dehydrogenase
MVTRSRKVVIIGAGHVGSHLAFTLLMQGECDEIILIDVDKEKAAAHGLDIADAGLFAPHPSFVRLGDYSDCEDADIVVLSAGVPRKPGQTRLDTMGDSIAVMKQIVEPLSSSGFKGILICISNPADIIADFMRKQTGFPSNKVFSTGTSLDSARFRRTMSELTGVDIRSISGFTMGEHGDSQMIPFSHVTIGGKPLLELKEEYPDTYGKLNFEHILERTKMIGMDIVTGKGATEFGIGAVLADMVKAIFHDEHRIMPVSALLQGEYGQKDVHAGVPAVIGRNGIEQIIEIKLTKEEQKQFYDSCDVIRKHIAIAETL